MNLIERIKVFVNDKSGQMSIELCVTLPVVLIFMVIAIDGMMYISACASFDHIANQAILAFGCTQDRNEFDQQEAVDDIKQAIEEQGDTHIKQVSVKAESCGLLGDLVKYTCQLSYSPWPLNTEGISIFGVHLSTSLKHERTLVVRPFVPGKL